METLLPIIDQDPGDENVPAPKLTKEQLEEDRERILAIMPVTD